MQIKFFLVFFRIETLISDINFSFLNNQLNNVLALQILLSVPISVLFMISIIYYLFNEIISSLVQVDKDVTTSNKVNINENKAFTK